MLVIAYAHILVTVHSHHADFFYPAAWLGDQTLARRAAAKAEQERGLILSPWDAPGAG